MAKKGSSRRWMHEHLSDEFVKKAQKSLEGGFFKNIMSSKWERLSKAKDNYEKAINNYKLGKKCFLTRVKMC